MAGRLRFPSRAKLKKLCPLALKPTPKPRKDSTLSDVLRTSLLALKESSDAFPPLKSAVGGVVALWEIAERAKHSKSGARDIAFRTKELLDLVADAVPDPSAISPPMLRSIEQFTVLLDEVRCRMDTVALTNGVSRVLNLTRNERTLQSIRAQLDDTYRDLVAASALRVEVQATQIAVQQTQLAVQQAQFSAQQAQTQLDVGKVAVVTDLIPPEHHRAPVIKAYFLF
ncbi:hypothetical protein B0H13DRAFT_1924639 [Mycena leptocephala]|nr:hypothetical protein B0H13DRAFT_1924639 [Mycena leptocephala]